MSDLFWLTDELTERRRTFFPKPRKAAGGQSSGANGIVFVNKNGLLWRDAPSAYGSPKALHNRWKLGARRVC